MSYHLEQRVEDDIIQIAKKNHVKKLILFGSRARGDNGERSDIDLAASGGDIMNFYYELEEDAHTLLMFDVVNLDEKISEELQGEIERDGVIIYEEV